MNQNSRSRTKDYGGYFTIPNSLIDDPTLPLHAKAVYMALARYAHFQNQTCFPSYALLAKMLGISKRTVIRSIHRLEEKGYIEVTRHTGRTHPNLYRLLQKDPPLKGDRESPFSKTERVTDIQERVTDIQERVTVSHPNNTNEQDLLTNKENLKNSSFEETPKGPTEEYLKKKKEILGHIRTPRPKTPPQIDLNPKDQKDTEKKAQEGSLVPISMFLPTVQPG